MGPLKFIKYCGILKRIKNIKINWTQNIRVAQHYAYCLSTQNDNTLCDRLCTKFVQDKLTYQG